MCLKPGKRQIHIEALLTDGTIRLKGPTINNVYGKNNCYPIASVAERLRYRVAGWKVISLNLGVAILFD